MPLRKRDDTLFELTCEEEINFFFLKSCYINFGFLLLNLK